MCVDAINQSALMVHRGRGQDAVAKVKNMTRATSHAFQNSISLLSDFRNRGKEDDRVQVALNGIPVAQAGACSDRAASAPVFALIAMGREPWSGCGAAARGREIA